MRVTRINIILHLFGTDSIIKTLAYVDGLLGCHPNIQGWTITHIPTGYAIIKKIRSKREALNYMGILNQMMDWNIQLPIGRNNKEFKELRAERIKMLPPEVFMSIKLMEANRTTIQ